MKDFWDEMAPGLLLATFVACAVASAANLPLTNTMLEADQTAQRVQAEENQKRAEADGRKAGAECVIYQELYRVEVPGGWLYRWNRDSGGVAFVPSGVACGR